MPKVCYVITHNNLRKQVKSIVGVGESWDSANYHLTKLIDHICDTEDSRYDPDYATDKVCLLLSSEPSDLVTVNHILTIEEHRLFG